MSRKKILLYRLCYKNDKINDKIKTKTDEIILSLIFQKEKIERVGSRKNGYWRVLG